MTVIKIFSWVDPDLQFLPKREISATDTVSKNIFMSSFCFIAKFYWMNPPNPSPVRLQVSLPTMNIVHNPLPKLDSSITRRNFEDWTLNSQFCFRYGNDVMKH